MFYILDVYHWQKTELLGCWHSMGVLMPVMIKSLQNNHWNGIAHSAPLLLRKRKGTPRFIRTLRVKEIYICHVNSLFLFLLLPPFYFSLLLYSFWKSFFFRRTELKKKNTTLRVIFFFFLQKNRKNTKYKKYKKIETRMNNTE